MPESIVVREKTTSDIVMQLLNDGSAIDLGSVDHVRLDIIDNNGRTYRYSTDDESPALVITTALTGIITFTPPNESVFLYQRSPYRLYAWIYETPTKKYSVPEDMFAQIDVEKEY